MGKAVGAGGIFLKALDPEALKAWYVPNLSSPISLDGYTSVSGQNATA